MARLITDTHDGSSQGLPCAGMRGARLQAGAVFVGGKEGLWHS